MLATWLTDNRRIDGEPEYDEALVRMAGIDASKLPPLRKTGTVIGPVRPEVAARWFLEPVDYLTMRFTGVASATPASMLATWLTDNRRIDGEPEYDDALVRMAGIDSSKLPPLRRTGTVIGPVMPAVADTIGLGRDVSVITGIPDLHGATVGSGAVGLYEPHLSISTTGWISCPLPKKKTDALHSMASVPGLGDGRYVLANSIDTSGVCLEWASGLFGGSIEELLAEAATSPPGAGGLVFTPWLGGTRSPVEDRFARAAWQNASGSATRGDFARAVLEGVALHGRWLHECVEKFAGRRLEPIRVIGGGARSDLWCQIHADVLDRPIERVADPASAILRGAGLFAGASLGLTDAANSVEIDATFESDPGNRDVYDGLFREFPRLHKAQRRLRRLTRAA
jgi:xylulokinase